MLEGNEMSLRETREIQLTSFKVDEAFQLRSYAKRYELVCERLVRERQYDAACFFTSNGVDGLKGKFDEPNPELGIRHFAVSLHARAAAIAAIRGA